MVGIELTCGYIACHLDVSALNVVSFCQVQECDSFIHGIGFMGFPSMLFSLWAF